MSSSFVPRRSPRLAAKAAKQVSPSVHAKQVSPSVHANLAAGVKAAKVGGSDCANREEARATYLRCVESRKHLDTNRSSCECYQTCVATISVFMRAMEEARGRTARAVIVTALNRHLLHIAAFLGLTERFANTVQRKMEEFLKEPAIPDAVVDADFRGSVKDVLYVLTGK